MRDLDSPGHVMHWAEADRETTLSLLMVMMVGETAQHAGHADVIRELIDGRMGREAEALSASAESTFWRDRRDIVQAAANPFRASAADELGESANITP